MGLPLQQHSYRPGSRRSHLSRQLLVSSNGHFGLSLNAIELIGRFFFRPTLLRIVNMAYLALTFSGRLQTEVEVT